MHLSDDVVAVTEKDGVVDCIHRASAVVVDGEGKRLWSIGNPKKIVFERSIIKPFRALSLIRAGCVRGFGLDLGDLALIAGSHSGTMIHVALAERILSKVAVLSRDLQCGVRLPTGADAMLELAENQCRLNVLHCDCSGEHIGALALCRHLGYSTKSYLDPTHPIHVRYADTVREFDDMNGFRRSVDRCGMPTSAVDLTTLAIRMARLLRARQKDETVSTLIAAIVDNPMTYTGRGRIVGELISRSGGAIFGKCGAEGLYVVVWPSGLALALKISDGNPRAAVPIIERAGEALGLSVPDLWDCVNTGEFARVHGTEAASIGRKIEA